MRTKAFLLALTLLLMLGLSGCDASNDDINIAPENYPATVNNITVTQKPAAVISLSPNITELFFEFGYQKALIARTDDCKYPEAVSDIPSIGSGANPDIKKIIEQNPELLITQSPLAKKDVDLLSEAKIQLLVIPMAKSFDELFKNYTSIATLFDGMIDGPKTSQKVYSVIKNHVDEVTAKIKLPKSTFMYTIALDGGTIATHDTFESAVLSLFGDNVATDTENYSADLKDLKSKDPDIIFLTKPYYKEHLQKNKQYKDFSAVKKSNVYSLDASLFEVQSSRINDSIDSIAKLLFPDMFDTDEVTSSVNPTSSN
jgi:iron complex transport system substrate-binding protein